MLCFTNITNLFSIVSYKNALEECLPKL